ncbi:MAG TPA: hypothetical protein VGR95_04985 [Thermoanaerobaculia bacterium]|jgi:hypothetical protein|nr:hypothetical protein [Thermoanaerobaculia bacterium]
MKTINTRITTKSPTTTTGADTPQPAVKLTPDAVIEQLRAMRSQIEQVAPLTKEQRKALKQRLRDQSAEIVAASINVIGVLDNVSQAIGQPLDDVLQVQNEADRWDAAASEARAFVNGIEGANLIRRQQLALVGRQAYSIGSQLALDPANAVLVPHVEEVKQLKSVSRRKKTRKTPETPAPTPSTTTPAPSTMTPAKA